MEHFEALCREIRRLTIESIYSIGKGHVGGSMSIVEVLAVLYFQEMNIDPSDPHKEGRDRLVVSKGHSGPAVYAALARRGYFPVDWLKTLNQIGTKLPSHCDMNRTPGIDMTAGSLGQGFSCAVGMATASQIKGDGATVYAIIGDGESQEGQIWEAALFAAHRKLDNLIAFTDCNGLQIDGPVDQVCSLGDLEGKWSAFGWHTQRVDGHCCQAISDAIAKAKGHPGQPSMILLDTVKGKGVSFAEKAGAANHSMSVGQREYELAMAELAEG